MENYNKLIQTRTSEYQTLVDKINEENQKISDTYSSKNAIPNLLNKIMYILITYDVQTEIASGQKRLRKVARLCLDYGQRVQNSVFECVLTEVQLAELKDKLLHVIDTQNDSIRIYFLNRSENRRIITLGKDNAIDMESILIV